MIWCNNLLKIAYHPFLYRTTFAFFHSEGNLPGQDLKISSKGGETKSPHNFSIRIMITSCPWALFGSRLFNILPKSALVIRID